MFVVSRNSRRLMMAGLAASALTFGVANVIVLPSTANASESACVNGVVPLNPYIVNCNLPSRGNHIVGAAPDAGAIIACRGQQVCLSYYVNYPGTLVVPGYRP